MGVHSYLLEIFLLIALKYKLRSTPGYIKRLDTGVIMGTDLYLVSMEISQSNSQSVRQDRFLLVSQQSGGPIKSFLM
jgi:hypothetical protein